MISLAAQSVTAISDTVHGIAAISSESAEATDTVASKVNYITESVANISSKVQELNEAAGNLNAAMEQIQKTDEAKAVK